MDYCNGCSSGVCIWSTDPFQDCQPASPPGIQWDHDPLLLHSLQQTVSSDCEPSHPMLKLPNQADAVGPFSAAASGHRMGSGSSQGLPCEGALAAEDWQSLDDLLFSAFDHDDAGDTVACHTPPGSRTSREFGPLSGGDTDDDQNVTNDESRKRHQKLKNRNLAEKRRRSRINERIETLHALIPNSVKRDKASMLDDVVEYMKSLQQQLQNASMGNGPDSSRSETFASEAYLMGCPNLCPLVGQGRQNRTLRQSGNAELQQGAISHVVLSSPFPQLFVAGASAMPLIHRALPLWTPTLPWPVAPINLNCQRLDSSEHSANQHANPGRSICIHFFR